MPCLALCSSISPANSGSIRTARTLFPLSEHCAKPLFNVDGYVQHGTGDYREVKEPLPGFEFCFVFDCPLGHVATPWNHTARSGLRFLSKDRDSGGRWQRLKIQGGSFVNASSSAFMNIPLRPVGPVFLTAASLEPAPREGPATQSLTVCARLCVHAGRVRFSGPMLAVAEPMLSAPEGLCRRLAQGHGRRDSRRSLVVFVGLR